MSVKQNWKKAKAKESNYNLNLLKEGDNVYFTEIENDKIAFIVIFQDYVLPKEEFFKKFEELDIQLRAEVIAHLEKDWDRRKASRALREKAIQEENKKQSHLETLSEEQKVLYLRKEEAKKIINVDNKSKTKKDKVILIFKLGFEKKDVADIMPIDFSYLNQLWEDEIEPLRRVVK